MLLRTRQPQIRQHCRKSLEIVRKHSRITKLFEERSVPIKYFSGDVECGSDNIAERPKIPE